MTKTVIIRGARREMDAGSLGFVLPPWLSRNSCVVRAALRNTSAGRACSVGRIARRTALCVLLASSLTLCPRRSLTWAARARHLLPCFSTVGKHVRKIISQQTKTRVTTRDVTNFDTNLVTSSSISAFDRCTRHIWHSHETRHVHRIPTCALAPVAQTRQAVWYRPPWRSQIDPSLACF